MTTANRWQTLFEELKRRRVFRVATLYLVAFWPLIQIVDILSPALALPDAVMKYLVIAFASGFPIALILAWIFDINKDGVSVTTEQSSAAVPMIGGRSELLIVSALLVLVAGLFAVQLWVVKEPEPTSVLGATQHSVGVLPFVSFSKEVSDQQFADGLTEEMLNVLARVKSLRVAARTSSFAYRGVNKNVTDIGKELNVGIILEGSVRRNDINDTIRVTAQLIDVASGGHLWSKTYDREFTDIFKIQDDIAASVVDELQITLLGDERKKIQSRESANPEAMVAYGLGQAELARRTEQSLIDATRYFEKALSLDTNYIDAYVGLGTAHSLMVSYGYGESEEFLPLGQDAINKAFAIDDKSGAAWASQGLLHMQKDDKQAAISALEKAMDYNPSHAMAVMWYAGLQEDINDRLRLYQKAFELDPRSPVIGYNVANNLLILGRESEAMQMFERIVEADPGYFGAYMLAARVNQSRGRVDEAINQYIKVYELSDSPDHAITIASMYSDLGDFEQSQMWLSKVKNDLPKSYEVYYDWQQFSSYASVDRLDEARPILLKKVTAATTTPDNSHFEDAALAAYFLGDFDTVIKYFEAIDDQATVDHFDNSNRIDAMLAAAYIYGLRGDHTKSEENLNKVENLIEQLTAKVPRIHGNIWYRKAQISAIRDDNRMALINLQRAIDEGWRGHWLTRIEPSLGSLRNEPAFQSMIAGLQTRMDIMREQLALASAFDSDWSG